MRTKRARPARQQPARPSITEMHATLMHIYDFRVGLMKRHNASTNKEVRRLLRLVDRALTRIVKPFDTGEVVPLHRGRMLSMGISQT